MNARDVLAMAAGNLRRMKLRVSLTVAGVVIAIAAFVSMLSFGAGNRRLVTRQFEEFGLFTTMQVYPREAGERGGEPGPGGHRSGSGGRQAAGRRSAEPAGHAAAQLDDAALRALAAIPGVRLAYPYQTFAVVAALADSQVSTHAQALPAAAAGTSLFGGVVAGTAFASDTTRTALVTLDLLEQLGIEDPETVLGRPLVLTVRTASIDSAMARAFGGELRRLGRRVGALPDTLSISGYRRRLRELARTELAAAASRFASGLLEARAELRDTLVVSGVIKGTHSRRLRMQPVLLPLATARRFSAGAIGDDPTELLAALATGALLAGGESGSDDGSHPGGRALRAAGYRHATLDLDPRVAYQAIRDSVEALGFRAFSFAEQFSEIRRFFFFFDLALAAIGCIALLTAALGIANTMMMSITERRREIGVLEALGADEQLIRALFLVESAVIGACGALLGILGGWLITRLASLVARAIMERQGIDPVELFATPLWLVLTAFFFGVGISLLAGLYPASRAARTDPVQALRSE